MQQTIGQRRQQHPPRGRFSKNSTYRVYFGGEFTEFSARTFCHLAAIVDLRQADRVEVLTDRGFIECCTDSGSTRPVGLREAVVRLRRSGDRGRRDAQSITGLRIPLTGTYAGARL